MNDGDGCECDEETLWCYLKISSFVKETSSKGKGKGGQHDVQNTIKLC